MASVFFFLPVADLSSLYVEHYSNMWLFNSTSTKGREASSSSLSPLNRKKYQSELTEV